MTRHQATKASRPQVLLHISRQRALGERLISDHDRPRPIEFVVMAIVLAALCFSRARGWI